MSNNFKCRKAPTPATEFSTKFNIRPVDFENKMFTCQPKKQQIGFRDVIAVSPYPSIRNFESIDFQRHEIRQVREDYQTRQLDAE